MGAFRADALCGEGYLAVVDRGDVHFVNTLFVWAVLIFSTTLVCVVLSTRKWSSLAFVAFACLACLCACLLFVPAANPSLDSGIGLILPLIGISMELFAKALVPNSGDANDPSGAKNNEDCSVDASASASGGGHGAG